MVRAGDDREVDGVGRRLPERAARPARHKPSRRRDVEAPPRTQWLLDSITMSAAFVRNGRLDVIAHNALGRALHTRMFDSRTTDKHGRPDFARYHFLDTGSRDFFVDWEAGAAAMQHPEVGLLELTYQSLDLPVSQRAVRDLSLYTAEPGSTSEERLKLLASLAATPGGGTEATDHLR